MRSNCRQPGEKANQGEPRASRCGPATARPARALLRPSVRRMVTCALHGHHARPPRPSRCRSSGRNFSPFLSAVPPRSVIFLAP